MGNRRCASRKTRCAEHRPGFYLAEQQVRKAWEDAAANSTGPAVAGTGEDSDTVVVKKKKRKTAIFKVTPEVFARFSKGKKKFERWNKYLNIEDEAEASIYSFARKKPTRYDYFTVSRYRKSKRYSLQPQWWWFVGKDTKKECFIKRVYR